MSEGTTIQITISGNALEKVSRLADKSVVLPALARALDYQNQLTVAHIQRAYMSFPKAGPAQPTGTRVQTNRLRSSLRASRCIQTGNGLESAIGSNVDYAATIEYGADIPSRPTRSRNKYYAKKHPVTKAFSLPERRPVRQGIDDRISNYTSAFEKSIMAL